MAVRPALAIVAADGCGPTRRLRVRGFAAVTACAAALFFGGCGQTPGDATEPTARTISAAHVAPLPPVVPLAAAAAGEDLPPPGPEPTPQPSPNPSPNPRTGTGTGTGVVTLTQMEIPAPLLRPGAIFQSDHMTVIRLRTTPPTPGAAVVFSLVEKPEPHKTYAPGTRPAMLTHTLVHADATGVARTWLIAGEMESEVTVKAVSPTGTRSKTVEISKSSLSQILDVEPTLPPGPPDKPDPSLDAIKAMIERIRALDVASGDAREKQIAALSESAATARAALQQAVSDPKLSDDTRRLCAKLLLGAPEQAPAIDFVAVLRDDRPAVQEAGLAALERHSVESIRPLQEQLMQSVDVSDRAMAVRLAGFLDEGPMAQAVEKALQDDDPLVVSLAIQFAAHFLDPAARQDAARHIFDARPLVAWTALSVIEETTARREAIPLSEQSAYDQANPLTVTAETLQAIRGLSGPAFTDFKPRALAVLPRLHGFTAQAWLELLVTGRWSDDELVQLITGLGYAPDPPREFLLKLARQPDSKRTLRLAAALACIHSTPPDQLQRLLAWFSDDREEVRLDAYQRFQHLTAHDFGELPEAQARILDFWREHGKEAPAEWMVHSIRSKDPMRDAAARELPGLVRADQLTAERALTALETMVDDAQGPAQDAAFSAIARLDPSGESSVSRRMVQAAATVLANAEDVRALDVLHAFQSMLDSDGYTHRAQVRLRLWEPLLPAFLHRNHNVREQAYRLCVRLSSVDFGFEPAGSSERIRAAQTQYREWFTRNMK